MNFANCKNITELYNIYYRGGVHSLYNKRFGNKYRVTMRENELLVSHLRNAIKLTTERTIKILDFGCGNGRTMPILYQNALIYKNHKFEFLAYDISSEGLKELSDLLLADGFCLLDYTHKEGYYLKKANITVKICLGRHNYSSIELEQLLGREFNLVLCLYGTLSHIPESVNRLDIIRMLKNIAAPNGLLLLSLPSDSSVKSSYIKRFNKLRSMKKIPDIFHLAKEKGDVYYEIKGSKGLYNYYHLYNIKEIKAQLKSIGLINFKIGIYSSFSIYQICQRRSYIIADYLLSKIFSLPLLRELSLAYFATDFFISAKICSNANTLNV